MNMNRKLVASALAALMIVLAALTWWNYPPTSRFSYAAENISSTAKSREGLSHAKDLSEAFNFVAETLRPSVVSISSVKHMRPRGAAAERRRQGATPQLPPGIPEEFRRFFGDDLFDRFGQLPDSMPDQTGLGSGVVVSADGYVLTNNHVVRDADEVNVTLFDDRVLQAKIVGVDDKTDLAVLKIEAKDLTPAKLGNSDEMKVGQWVLAIGSPFGLDQTVTAGIISAKGRVTGIIGNDGYEDFLQTDAAINPGNSGGPLVNMQGEVIGVNTAIASRGGLGGIGNVGVGFAIPSNMAQNIMHSIITTGKVVRGFLGAGIQPLDENLARSFEYKNRHGVLVAEVVPDSPAQKAGLREGDIVTELNGRPVETTSQLRNGIAALAPKSKATLGVFRGGKTQKVEVTVGEKKATETAAIEESEPAETSSELGLTVEPLTPDLAERVGHKYGTDGVIVTEVAPGSIANRALIQPGDVIVSIGAKPIKNTNDYRAATEKLGLKAGVRIQVMREGSKRFVFLKSAD